MWLPGRAIIQYMVPCFQVYISANHFILFYFIFYSPHDAGVRVWGSTERDRNHHHHPAKARPITWRTYQVISYLCSHFFVFYYYLLLSLFRSCLLSSPLLSPSPFTLSCFTLFTHFPLSRLPQGSLLKPLKSLIHISPICMQRNSENGTFFSSYKFGSETYRY